MGIVLTATAERAGKLLSKFEAYTSLKAAKSDMSARKTVVFTISARVKPAAVRMALMFLKTCAVCSLILPSTNRPVAGSMANWPETNN